MTKTEYLYGKIPQSIIEQQKTLAKAKISCAYNVLKDLLEVDYKKRDDSRIRAIHKAIKHNERILEEIL